MSHQQFENSGDDGVPPRTNTPPWIVTPPPEPPPWLQTPVAPPPVADTPPAEVPPWAPPTYGEPAWIVSGPPPGPPPSSPGRSRRPLIAVAAAVLVVLIGAGGGWFVTHRGEPAVPDPVAAPTTLVPAPDPTTVAVTTYPTEYPTESPTTVETSTVADPEQDALAELDRISAQDLREVVFDNRYVAQVASKNPGTYDKFQTTASGSHTFQATDILAEYQRLRDDLGSAKVVLLKSTDFGKRQMYRGAPLYVTFFLGRFGSADAVRSWCAATFPDLSADALANQCAVRRMH